jgi:dienelactone hydrolase
MGRAFLVSALLAVSFFAAAETAKMAPPKRDMRSNPPGKFLSPGYYIPNVFIGETETIAASDGYKLAADYVRRKNIARLNLPGILYLHEEGKTRRSWYPLTVQLAGRNYASLAVDLRGCGENPGINADNKASFDSLPEADIRKMLEDVRNAVSYLAMRPGVDGESIAIIGAGLGANLALAAAAEPWAKNVKVVVALSPTLDNHGYRTEEAVRKAGKSVMICLAASQGDATSYQASSALYRLAKGPKEFFEGEGSMSGTGLFGTKSAVPAAAGETAPLLFALIPKWVYEGLIGKYPAPAPQRRPATR